MEKTLRDVAALVVLASLTQFSWAQVDSPATPSEPAAPADQPSGVTDDGSSPTSQVPPASRRPEPPSHPNWKRLTRENQVWIDPGKKTVIVAGEVCHREGPLEMFACPRNTKEYESIVAVDCKAYVVHAALLAVGAVPGRPVEFTPEYKAASGPIVDISVVWLDEQGRRQETRAQNWIRHAATGKPMPYEWVFAGSQFWTEQETGEKHYYAEGGELICVSNFSTATLDLPVESSQDNVDLMFSAFTEHIPPEGTRVQLLLTPRGKPDSTQLKSEDGGAEPPKPTP